MDGANDSLASAIRAEKPVLAIRAGALGDTIVALPAVAQLARIFPRVEVLGRAPYVDLALGRGLAATVHDIDRAGFGALFDEGYHTKNIASAIERVLAGAPD